MRPNSNLIKDVGETIKQIPSLKNNFIPQKSNFPNNTIVD
jgi:hypothetical protein